MWGKLFKKLSPHSFRKKLIFVNSFHGLQGRLKSNQYDDASSRLAVIAHRLRDDAPQYADDGDVCHRPSARNNEVIR